MLRIKRASAGSGKTYELAKFYIKLLISTKQQGFKRLLMKDESFRDSLGSIMAVTFTVKATAEMKQRIVEKLADLGRADSHDINEDGLKKIDYLNEFIDDFKTDRFVIADLARRALRTLLLNYSDFRVQTIDSFFQSILHTFVYEASIDDNFNMEINTDLVTSMGFGAALDDLSENTGDSETLHWLRKMMDKSSRGNKWNVFSRDESSKSLYSQLIFEAKNLEKEDYQRLKEELFRYFSKAKRPFREVVKEVDEANIMPWKFYHDIRRDKAAALYAELVSAGLAATDLCNGRSYAPQLEASMKEFDPEDCSFPSMEIFPRKTGKAVALSKKGEDKIKEAGNLNPYVIQTLNTAFVEWSEANNSYLRAFEPERNNVMTWLEYRALIPKLMVVLEIARRKDEYLQATNSLQISDTSHILSRIIGDDDAPFVYERMGSRLSHYLIDEFQDTSNMQWHNLKPLIDESEARGEENLIIGDAKQSIYRFRNADYTLISSLENEFKDVVYYTQETPPTGLSGRNINFRSARRIVEFNNIVFSNITTLTAGSDNIPIFTDNIREVYHDCRQDFPESKDGPEGYVETVFYPKKQESLAGDGESGITEGPGFLELPQRIMALKKRGYAFRDIGILVKNHKDGFAVINAISVHNAANPDNQIRIISEENLLVASSLSVKIIIQALETAAAGMRFRTKDNPVVSDPVSDDELFKLLRSLNTLALPSVVEAIIGRFIPASRRNAEAPFIAAFQDAVLDYCAVRPGDIGSFLKWWRQKAKTLSITSPEGSDGVTLQTIHKSKGLEYKCVIIPYAGFSFSPGSFTEWRWVKVHKGVAAHELLPPYLPVLTHSSLEETAHAAEVIRYREEFALDELNKMYVAFTRAARELYIYVPVSQHNENRKSGATLKSVLLPPREGFSVKEDNDGRLTVTYGLPASTEELAVENERLKKKESSRNASLMTIDSYNAAHPHTDRTDTENEAGKNKSLLFHNDSPLKTIIHPDGTEEEIDPRAEGTLKHRIMQMVEVAEDLDIALRRMKVEGYISASQVDQWGEELRKAIKSVENRGWFAHGVRVLTERPVMKKGIKRIPDRVIITPEGKGIVIDYKFGEDEAQYIKQIREYVSLLLESGICSDAEAFLWYVPQGKILQVGTDFE